MEPAVHVIYSMVFKTMSLYIGSNYTNFENLICAVSGESRLEAAAGIQHEQCSLQVLNCEDKQMLYPTVTV